MPASKNYVKIQYPRKCEQCDYMSNNPSMFHYHKKTHAPVPPGKLCDHGCGTLATCVSTGGVFSCLPTSVRCPAYIKEHSARIVSQWEAPNSNERRLQTKARFMKHCCGNLDTLTKFKATLKKKFGDFTPEQMQDFRHYARRVRARAQRWAKEQGYELGITTLHVDHKLSIRDAWLAGLSESIVNHPANLQVLPATENCSKGWHSSLTIGELMDIINDSKI